MNKLVRYFADADMRKGHDGLTQDAKKEGLDMRSLGAGEYVVFLNKRKDRLKMFAGPDVIAYLKLRDGKRVDPRIIQYLPKYFNGTEINYTGAQRKMLEGYFPKYFGASK